MIQMDEGREEEMTKEKKRTIIQQKNNKNLIFIPVQAINSDGIMPKA